ncbi:MAG TPA: hypothetical protein VLA09_06580 [Longimicrobiales bacterium]|nr:hypothetical protein [Longimicrobiales bacterium]
MYGNARLVAWVLAPLVAVAGCIGENDVTFPEDRQAIGGTIAVNVTTSGVNLDPDGYEVSLDEELSQSVPANGSVSFSALRSGSFEVTLGGVASNCALSSQNPQTVSVSPGSTVSVAFMVACA